MNRELKLLFDNPPFGICAYLKDPSNTDIIESKIKGPKDTPYENGIFKVEIKVTDSYPLQPPVVRFITKIYHVNIDDSGRICLDLLKMPPQGSWKPSINLTTVLTSIQLLLSEPNINDPLMPEIGNLFSNNRRLFNETASNYTKKYAVDNKVNDVNMNKKKGLEKNDDYESDSDSDSDSLVGKKRKLVEGKSENQKKKQKVNF